MSLTDLMFGIHGTDMIDHFDLCGLMCHGRKINMLGYATNVLDAAIKCHNLQCW